MRHADIQRVLQASYRLIAEYLFALQTAPIAQTYGLKIRDTLNGYEAGSAFAGALLFGEVALAVNRTQWNTERYQSCGIG